MTDRCALLSIHKVNASMNVVHRITFEHIHVNVHIYVNV